MKATRIMCDLHGIPTLSYRCAAHSSDGTLKRLVQSKIMCIVGIVELYESLSLVVKHFSYSFKNKEALSSLLSWCNTQMAHFLDPGTQIR